MLGELGRADRTIVFDMEAGAGTLLRLEPGDADVVLVVTEPTAKSIEAARRLAQIATSRARVLVVANKVAGEEDAARVRRAFPGHELTVVPDDEEIERADRDGRAPVDAGPQSPGVRALVELASALGGYSSTASSQQRT